MGSGLGLGYKSTEEWILWLIPKVEGSDDWIHVYWIIYSFYHPYTFPKGTVSVFEYGQYES